MQGVIVASDERQEWLLPWWWEHYASHNAYPVVFFDLGMSKEALHWCRSRGQCLTLPKASPLKKVPNARRRQWEARWGRGIWGFRSAWFKKPIVCQMAPFAVNCWLDIDCQVLGNLQPLFDSLTDSFDWALAKEDHDVNLKDLQQKYIFLGETSYNSGVLLFRKNDPILAAWVKGAREQNNRFLSDQTLLSRLFFLHETRVKELPFEFNWHKSYGPNPKALILHYNQSAKLELLQTILPNI